MWCLYLYAPGRIVEIEYGVERVYCHPKRSVAQFDLLLANVDRDHDSVQTFDALFPNSLFPAICGEAMGVLEKRAVGRFGAHCEELRYPDHRENWCLHRITELYYASGTAQIKDPQRGLVLAEGLVKEAELALHPDLSAHEWWVLHTIRFALLRLTLKEPLVRGDKPRWVRLRFRPHTVGYSVEESDQLAQTTRIHSKMVAGEEVKDRFISELSRVERSLLSDEELETAKRDAVDKLRNIVVAKGIDAPGTYTRVRQWSVIVAPQMLCGNATIDPGQPIGSAIAARDNPREVQVPWKRNLFKCGPVKWSPEGVDKRLVWQWNAGYMYDPRCDYFDIATCILRKLNKFARTEPHAKDKVWIHETVSADIGSDAGYNTCSYVVDELSSNGFLSRTGGENERFYIANDRVDVGPGDLPFPPPGPQRPELRFVIPFTYSWQRLLRARMVVPLTYVATGLSAYGVFGLTGLGLAACGVFAVIGIRFLWERRHNR